jgi:hypothetical protein
MNVATPPLGAPGGEPPELVRVEDFERVQHYLHAYLASERFRSAHPQAYERWSGAATTLYRQGKSDNVLAAGVQAREALKEFARSLAQSHDAAPANPASVEAGAPPRAGLDGLSSVIEACRSRVGDSRCDLLHSLCRYWLVLDGTVGRDARGADGSGAPPSWEDGRRLVVLTALVMVEVDRSF